MTALREKVPDRDLDALRAKIARLEGGPASCPPKAGPTKAGSEDGGGAPPRRPVVALGVKAIDGHLPWGGLPAGALHEIIAGDVGAAATAFALSLAASFSAHDEGRGRKGPAAFLWCVNGDVPYGPGLGAFGIEERQLLVVRGRNDRDVLWAAEEGLGAHALAAVFAEIHALDLTASRRLALAARKSGVTAFALRPFGSAPAAPGEAGYAGQSPAATGEAGYAGQSPAATGEAGYAGQSPAATGEAGCAGQSPAATAALTRWRVRSAQSLGEVSESGVGTACWRLELLRCRNAMPKAWRVAWRGMAAARWDVTRPAAQSLRAAGRKQAWEEEHGRENGGGGETGGLSLAAEISDRPDHPGVARRSRLCPTQPGKESGRTYTTTPLGPAANRASGA
jgi:protein ImuA